MQFARVIGNCVCTTKDEKLPKEKLLVIQPVDLTFKKPAGGLLVGIDVVGAGTGELFLDALDGAIGQDAPVGADNPFAVGFGGGLRIDVQGPQAGHLGDLRQRLQSPRSLLCVDFP